MTKTIGRFTAAMLLTWTVLFSQITVSAQDDKLGYPDLSKAQGASSKSAGTNAKLSPDLRILVDQFSGGSKSGAASGYAFSDTDLRELFGISNDADDPSVGLAITVRDRAGVETLKQRGVVIYMVQGNTVYGKAPVRSLSNLATASSIVKIASTKATKSPVIPKSNVAEDLAQGLSAATAVGSKSGATAAPLANEFNKASLTGKGVVVGVIDSGIDWKHPDFIKADGTSRILAIWDLYDDSFTKSGGKIGTAPPKLDPAGEPLSGTVYTNAQINAALKGTGTVNTQDRNGHGTAVAGTAAGNGRASNGLNAGVAPDADLLIVKASDCGSFTEGWIYGAAWITAYAKSLKKPVVVNGSFGGHFSAHDGKDTEEVLLNTMTGKGIPGVVFTISAGNEGESSMHAVGRFGPKRPGQLDVTSAPISVTISQERTSDSSGKSMLLGIFDARDDWALAVVGSANASLKDKNGKRMVFYLLKSAGQIKYVVKDGLVPPDGFDSLMNSAINYSQLGTETDLLTLPLPHGTYELVGLSTSAKVTNGAFDFYAVRDWQVDFGRGTTKTGMVGSPGNAANVITVGAYNFRNSWTNFTNASSAFNFPIGTISDYSSPGGRRKDGVFKPDIAAPATYTLSPLSQGAALGSGGCGGDNMGEGSGDKFVLPGGKYIAWQGTSASAPFTAGVIALLLQKNPTLDAEQVRQILIKSAKKGAAVGAVPNPEWGYGMLDPAAAITATPAATGGAAARRK
jgi:minor extracellular serine protease Vpr